MLELAYQMIKDIAGLAKVKEEPPIDPGNIDVAELKKMGLIDGDADSSLFGWCNPNRLYLKTQSLEADSDVVWITERNMLKIPNHKRKIVRYDSRGQIELILIMRRNV